MTEEQKKYIPSKRMKYITLYNQELLKCKTYTDSIHPDTLQKNEKYQENKEKIIKEWDKYKKFEERFYKKMFTLTQKKNKILHNI